MQRRPILAALGLFVALPWLVLAQDYRENRELPQGVVGERIRDLIDVFNSNDGERVRVFLETACSAEFRATAPMEEHLAVFADAYRRSGGFDFYGVREYEGEPPVEGTVVIVRNRLTENWHALVLVVDPQPPHRITDLGFGPARPPRDLDRSAEKLTNEEIVSQLDAFVKRLAEADVFSGSVLLAKDGKVLYRAAHGLASKRFDVPNRVDTKFNLGSMNKMFTAVAIQQLVERGKVKLTDPISKYVSTEWLPKEITEKVQVQHLLTHTSGLGSYFNETFSKSSRLLFRDLEDYKPLIQGETLSFEPGTDWRYSNTGMFLLGVVIESATGADYFSHVRDNIYKPAGMKNSDCYDMDRPVKNLAIGYTHEGGEWANNLYLHVVRGGPAGGGFSTVEDLLLFDQALRSHRLLSREGTEKVWSAKPELGSPSYGFGFRIDTVAGDRVVGHSGGFAGINSNLDMFLDSGYTAIVMSNYDNGATPVQQKMRELIAAAE
jgi:CubicO group peptidase (beta-lactamase class C family)